MVLDACMPLGSLSAGKGCRNLALKDWHFEKLGHPRGPAALGDLHDAFGATQVRQEDLLDGGPGCVELADLAALRGNRFDQGLSIALRRRCHDIVFGRKVAEERAVGDARPARDLLDGDLVLLFDQNRERLSVARRSVAQTQEQFRQRVIETTTQAIHAYWELDYALNNLRVQIEAVRLAEQQDASNRRQVEQGIQAPVDVIQTQTQVSTYQQNVFNAQLQLTQAENTLKALMLPNRSDPLWSAALKTATSLDESSAIPTFEEAIQQALAERPDLKAGQIGVKISEIDARLAREQVRPRINLTAQAGVQGLAGRTVTQAANPFGAIFGPLFTRVDELSALAGLPPVDTSGLSGSSSSVPGFFIGGYGESLQTLRDGRFPTVQVGLQISLPIGNRTARAEAHIAETNTRQSVAQQTAALR